MNYKIGIFGSNPGKDEPETDAATLQKAKELGAILGKKKLRIVTGACSGLPYLVASIANKYGSEVWGYSPEIDVEHQKLFTPEDDLSIYTKIIYMPKDFELITTYEVCRKYRNVLSTATCDAGIIISGRWGTMNEFTCLHDYGKVIGVLTGTGGIADELPVLYKKIKKKSNAVVIFESETILLIKKIITELKKKTKLTDV